MAEKTIEVARAVVVQYKEASFPFGSADEVALGLSNTSVSIRGFWDDVQNEITLAPEDYTLGGPNGALLTLTDAGMAKMPAWIRAQLGR